MLSKLVRVAKNRYRLPKSGKMRVDAEVYLDDDLLLQLGDAQALKQLADAACLPGVWGKVVGLPDIHAGFGLLIGGVMAVDSREGVVSAGAVGMDINCGVRLLRTNFQAQDLDRTLLRDLMNTIQKRVPAGLGKKGAHRGLSRILDTVLQEGARAVVDRGLGTRADLEATEEYGCLAGADPRTVSDKARIHGDQLGTIGGGNHFIEIGVVDRVFQQDLASLFGLHAGMLTVMIHTGSRRFGYEICTHYSRLMKEAARRQGLELPSKGLACALIDSEEGRSYLSAMACGVNFAFANRQLITHEVREAFYETLKTDAKTAGMEVVYDVAHNIAKFEDFHQRSLLVHRKGATRALPPGLEANPRKYRASGHPAIVPGSMGSPSFVVVGTGLTRETFFSVNHGAGRVMSRQEARKRLTGEDFARSMEGILHSGRGHRKLLDEAPDAYKPIEQVVDTLADIGLTRKVARLQPLAVIKGED